MSLETQDTNADENNHDQQSVSADKPSDGTSAKIHFIYDNVPNFNVCESD